MKRLPLVLSIIIVLFYASIGLIFMSVLWLLGAYNPFNNLLKMANRIIWDDED